MTAFGPFGSVFEGHGSPPSVNGYMCIPPEFKRRCLHRLFAKSACKLQSLPCIGELYRRFKQNVPELESRQFDGLLLTLRLLARCHDSGRLRLRTPAYSNRSVLWRLCETRDMISPGSGTHIRFQRVFYETIRFRIYC